MFRCASPGVWGNYDLWAISGQLVLRWGQLGIYFTEEMKSGLIFRLGCSDFFGGAQVRCV